MNQTRTPGRQPDRGVRASESIRVPLTPDELAWVDGNRGQERRATFLRRRALAAPGREGARYTREDMEPLRPFLTVYLKEYGKRWDMDPKDITLRTLADHMEERGMVPAVMRLAMYLGLPSGEPDEDDSWRNE